jgi:N-acetylmuramoyl-L-alanine amidase
MRPFLTNKLYYQMIFVVSAILIFNFVIASESSITLNSDKDSIKIDFVSINTSLLPLYEVVSYYEADFQWDSAQEQVNIKRGNVSINLTIGNPHILVNNSKLKLLTEPPNIYQGVPVLSPKDTATMLSNLIPSMIFTYNESESSITAKKNLEYDSSTINSAKPKTQFDDINFNDGFDLPGNFDLRTVVIDAGHGGHDSGASRSGVHEKDIVLDVAKRLGKLLKNEKSLNVVLTRDTDVFIPLPQRTSIANRYPPDSTLFVCLHVNASPSKSGGSGTETYVFNLEATDAEARALAKRENAGEAMDLTIILSRCYHTGTEPYSLDIAKRVQRTLTSQLGLRDRGVRKAPFYVLAGTKMPAILVELAYVSNSEERQRMQTDSFRQQTAEALYDAIMGFKSAVSKSLVKAKAN